MSIRVLVDNSVSSDANVAQWGTRTHSTQWGPHTVTTEVMELRRRPMPAGDQTWRIENIKALPTISRLARELVITLCQSPELQFESFTRKRQAVATVGELLPGSLFVHVDSAVERSYFQMTTNLREHIDGENLRRFCKMLLQMTEEQASRLSQSIPNLSSSSRAGLGDLDRFRLLCRHAAEKHYPDLFHWWTAERRACQYFLTMDQKLINFGTRQCRGVLKASLVDPSGLLEALGIKGRDPMPFELSEALSYFAAMPGDRS